MTHPMYQTVRNLFDPSSKDNLNRTILEYGNERRDCIAASHLFCTHLIRIDPGTTVCIEPALPLPVWGALYEENGRWIRNIAKEEACFQQETRKAMGFFDQILPVGRLEWTNQTDNPLFARIYAPDCYKNEFAVWKKEAGCRKPGWIGPSDFEKRIWNGLPYRLYVPKDWDGKAPLPLVLFLHGAGERGEDNEAQLRHAILPLINASSQARQAIYVLPQCPKQKRWVETDWSLGSYRMDLADASRLDAVLALLEAVRKEFAIDADRIYGVGISMGAFGIWNLLMRQSGLFAAAIPICGCADPAQLAHLADLPILAAHGMQDEEVPFQGAADIQSAMQANAARRFSVKVFKEGKHDIWDPFCADPAAGQWLFARRKRERTGLANWIDAKAELEQGAQNGPLFWGLAHRVGAGNRCSFSLLDENEQWQLLDVKGEVLGNFTRLNALAFPDHLEWTVPKGGAMIRFGLHKEHWDSFSLFVNLKTDWPKESIPFASFLKGRSVLFFGDSITNAAKDEDAKNGWAGRIGERYAMNWRNAGINGASVSNAKPENRVIHQLESWRESADLVVLHGMMNDAIQNAPAFHKAGMEPADSFEGALDELIQAARLKFPQAAIGFVINYTTPNSDWGGASRHLERYAQAARKVCAKNHVPVFDMADAKVFANGAWKHCSRELLQTQTPLCLSANDPGEVHIGAAGYDRIAGPMAQWMESIVGMHEAALRQAADLED